MPHVEILGAAPLVSFHENFRPRSVRDGDAVLKATASFIGREGAVVLLDCLAIEGRLCQSYFMLLTSRPGGIMVRLLPRTSPEKTNAVRRSVAWVALWIQGSAPGARVGATNLDAELERPFAPDPRPTT